ncbi:hypothetical protein [Parabacteroides gordonii]|uniref:DUF4906 domain-containing protein n=1 Tax=Parabacteroides gordonii TaxID=574930 RepID=UPI0026EF6350|nr:hypothetical protein [Parabacteroides gordonii]
MKHILYTISLLVLLGACTDEAFNDEPSAGGSSKPGKPVSVNLSLNLQPLQSPLDADTKAGSRVVSSTEVCKGMEISLVKTPVAPETRALEDEVKNFSVFQFDGTKPKSKLVNKLYIDNSSVETVKLTEFNSEKNRIIVIANAEKKIFDAVKQLDPDKPLDSTTLEQFNNLGSTYDETKSYYPLFLPNGVTNPDEARPILVGSADIVVVPNAQADIMLYRSTAKVKVTLTLGPEMVAKNFTSWTYQFMSVPLTSFYHSIGREPAFPGAAAKYGSYESKDIFKSTTTEIILADLPVNLHHGVPFTTPEKRVTNAPVNSTYLQIMGTEFGANNVITRSVVYQIHLGSNFTDDYSISPNYDYTYTININGENDDDSRVIKFIPGYFGGDLVMTKNSSTDNPYTWKYQNRIEVYIQDVSTGVRWLAESTPSPENSNSLMDGRKNTEELLGNKESYPAAKLCIELNGKDVNSSNLEWYMPSFGQALGIYVSGSNTLKTLPDETYWTSSFGYSKAWGIGVWSGLSNAYDPGSTHYLRCIKDIK